MSDLTVIAHRGFAGVEPENTVAAARSAANRGADIIEIDVQPTADGDVVVVHGSQLDDETEHGPLTDREGVVWQQPTSVVTTANVLGTRECVPLLSDVLTAVPEAVDINIELKTPGSSAIRPGEALDGDDRATARQRWATFVQSVLDVSDRFGHEFLYSSFCEGALAALDDANASGRRAVLVAPTCADAGETVARRYAVDAIHLPVSMLRVGTDFESVAADLGARRNCWTVEHWRDVQRARDSGLDGIITDYPGVVSATTA